MISIPGCARCRPAAAPEVVRAVPPERSGRVALLTVNTAIDGKLPSEANPGSQGFERSGVS